MQAMSLCSFSGQALCIGEHMGFRISFAKRKGHIDRFSWKDNLLTRFALIALFLFGLYICIQYGFRSSIAYIILWVASYLVLFAGTCRRCAYYGKACPIPLEGSLVCHILPKSDKPFTWAAIFYASIAYVLRIGIPIAVIIKERLVIQGILFGLLLIIFWVAHLFFSGCPNCVNYQCPLNSGNNERMLEN